MRRRIIQIGYWSSVIFAGLILVTPLLGGYLYPWQQAVGFSYLVIQFVEINSEDHLRNKDVLKDHLLSAVPAILGLLMLAAIAASQKFMAPEAWKTLEWWTGYAWFDFVGGIVMNNTILNAPYQREERADER